MTIILFGHRYSVAERSRSLKKSKWFLNWSFCQDHQADVWKAGFKPFPTTFFSRTICNKIPDNLQCPDPRSNYENDCSWLIDPVTWRPLAQGSFRRTRSLPFLSTIAPYYIPLLHNPTFDFRWQKLIRAGIFVHDYRHSHESSIRSDRSVF